MKPGDWVKVNAYGGKELLRRVVEVKIIGRKKVVCVTTDEEWQASQKEGREPVCVGFPLDHLRM